MKNYRLHLRPAGLFLTALIMGSILLFTSCEQENEVLLQAKMQTGMENQSKQAMKDMPKKELAALRAYTAPYHNFEKALEDGYVADITGYRTMMGHHF